MGDTGSLLSPVFVTALYMAFNESMKACGETIVGDWRQLNSFLRINVILLPVFENSIKSIFPFSPGIDQYQY